MSALFACSRCFSRHPFEELSQGQQLCKECRGSFPIVKCTYCRSEFQQESKSSTVTICKKCESMVKQHGKPSACEYCNVIAAFIGNKCQRCTNSERKYGPPLSCDQCKQKCAFDRKDIDKKKVDGKLLCWLCTLSYKRALAKTKVTDPARHSHIKLGSRSGHHKDKERHKLSGHNKRPNRPDVTKIPQEEPPAKLGLYDTGKDTQNMEIHDNFKALVSRNSGPMRDDPGTADQLVLITQLREQIAHLEKQLSGKDAQLLAKEKQMTELKASQFTIEQELRQKMKNVSREFDSKVEILQKKIREQTREIALLNRGKKKGDKNAVLSATDGGSSGTDSPSVG
ncbi:protein FAM76A-like isoform X1 [Portunus trituberculatus]|uniref:protein FAM76A-like isoform X1 n=1 Tax=Portunus trituberculatus TaxID=210409 RepID=UPI001E1CC318|nr:protein FAM76A-like isoform X1 [Portunus trituberculatus]